MSPNPPSQLREITNTVYTMPERFVPKEVGGGNNFIKLLIILIVLVAIAGGAVFYFMRQNAGTNDNQTNTIVNTPGQNTNAAVGLVLSSATVPEDGSTIRLPSWSPVANLLTDRLLVVENPTADTADNQTFAATISIGRTTTTVTSVSEYVTSILEDLERRFADFAVVSQRSVTVAGREALLAEWSYTSSAGAPLSVVALYVLTNTTLYDVTATALTNAYPAYRNDFITVLTSFSPSSTLSNTNTTVNTNTALNTNTTITNSNTNTSIIPITSGSPLPLANDADHDGLTALEETLYGTNPSLPDTDNDGFIDGYSLSLAGVISGEVALGYNPSGEGALKDSLLVSGYSNPDFHFSFIYPASWSVEAVVSDNSNILITPAPTSDEFIQVNAVANPDEMSAYDWYLTFNPAVDPQSFDTFSVNGIEGVITADRSVVYLAKGEQIYLLYYNTGGLTSVNYRATFEMILQSFKLTGTAT